MPKLDIQITNNNYPFQVDLNQYTNIQNGKYTILQSFEFSNSRSRTQGVNERTIDNFESVVPDVSVIPDTSLTLDDNILT